MTANPSVRSRAGRRRRRHRVGFPKSREDMFEFYEFIRKRHARRRQGEQRRARVPGAATCSRTCRKWETTRSTTRSRCSSLEHGPARHHARRSSASRTTKGAARCASYPDRFFASIGIDPNEGMDAVRKIDRYANEFDLKSVRRFPAGPLPAGRDQRQEVLPDLREVHRARHHVLLDRGRARTARPVRAAGRRAASTRCAGSSPS